MLFMVIEHFRADCATEVYRRFRDKGRMAPDGVTCLASWVDLEYSRCFQVMDAPTADALCLWTAKWEDLIDFEIVPVRTSAEAALMMAARLQGQRPVTNA